jgi:uncharacterized membrane protein YbaN (DUF454 family)
MTLYRTEMQSISRNLNVPHDKCSSPAVSRAARWASAPMCALTAGRLAAVARMKKYAFITFGVIFLVVGIVALAIPVLPTTPFLILAAYCFSKGSDYLHDWILNHKWFGPPIQNWRRNGAIKVQYKIVATLAMAGTGVMIYFETHIPPAGKITYAVFVAALLGFIWSRPGVSQRNK